MSVFLENNRVRLDVDERSGIFRLVDRESGIVWDGDPWDGNPGTLWISSELGGPESPCHLKDAGEVHVVRGDAGTIRITFGDLIGTTGDRIPVVLVVDLSISSNSVGGGGEVVVEISGLRLPSGLNCSRLDYPVRSFALKTMIDDGYLVVPDWEGALIPTSPVKFAGTVDFWSMEDNSRTARGVVDIRYPSMPWFGGRSSRGGFMFVADEAADLSLEVYANNCRQEMFDRSGTGAASNLPRIAAATPVWSMCQGELGYPRRFRIAVSPSLTYETMARVYRHIAKDRGEFRSLREKMESRPTLEKILGAPNIALYAGYPHHAPGYPGFEYRYDDVRAAVHKIHDELQLERAFIHFWGAYSNQSPKSIPFDMAPGSVEDLKRVVSASQDYGYPFALYNDFTALLEESPHWESNLLYWQREHGPGSERRWNRVCSTHFMDLVRGQMPAVKDALDIQATYVDCLGTGWRECYSPEHPVTRKEDMENRIAVFRYLTEELGLVYGGEHIQSWGVPYVDYSNGMGMPSRPAGVLTTVRPPLWHLSFHDALIAYCHAADDYSATRGTDFSGKLLRDALYGVPPCYFINLRDFDAWSDRIRFSDQATGDILRHLALDDMIEHEYLTEDYQVQRTRWESGTEVVVNFSPGDQEVDGLGRVGARSVHASGGGLKSISRSFGYHMQEVGSDRPPRFVP